MVKKAKTTKKVTATNRHNKGVKKKTKTVKSLVVKEDNLKDIKKEKEFKIFLLWMTLPSVFVGKPDNYLKQMGINDENALEVMQIRTMKDFAKKYEVRPQTLTDWKKKITKRDMIDGTKDFFKRLSKNVYASFYHATIKHGDAQRVRLWEEIFNGKEAEGLGGQMPTLLGGEFTQVIINLKGKYNSSLKEEYEKQIRNKKVEAEKVSSTE